LKVTDGTSDTIRIADSDMPDSERAIMNKKRSMIDEYFVVL
jgi:hypothetical protein